jgi:hypothetical protein
VQGTPVAPAVPTITLSKASLADDVAAADWRCTSARVYSKSNSGIF